MPWPGASKNVSVSFACKCHRLRAELENAAIPIAVNLAAVDGKRSRIIGQNEGASAAGDDKGRVAAIHISRFGCCGDCWWWYSTRQGYLLFFCFLLVLLQKVQQSQSVAL